jgi:hypothetical protein
MRTKPIVCSSDDLHPSECDGPGKCVHCDQIDTSTHDPNLCALCDGEQSDVQIYGAGVK